MHEVARALIADLGAVAEAVETADRQTAQKVIAAKLAAWKAAIVATRGKA